MSADFERVVSKQAAVGICPQLDLVKDEGRNMYIHTVHQSPLPKCVREPIDHKQLVFS